MADAANDLAGAADAAIRRVLRLIERNNRGAARRDITALLQMNSLSTSWRSVLEGLSSYADHDDALAMSKFMTAVDLDQHNHYAHYLLAEIHAKEGHIPAAIASVERALKIYPKMAESWFLHGGLAFREKAFAVALGSLLQAIRCDIDNEGYWHRLNYLLPAGQIQGPLATVPRALLIEALRRRNIEFQIVDQVIYVALKLSANIQQLLTMARVGALRAQVMSGNAIRLLDDEFFLLVLQHTTLHHAGYEKLLTDLRRALLETIAANAVPPSLRDLAIRSASALAIYALTTEFVFFVTEAEALTLVACRGRLYDMPVDDADLPMVFAIVACYEQLAMAADAVVVKAQTLSANMLPEFREMISLHILEHTKINLYQAGVKSFSGITNTVSLAVQGQYEENPYPRWRFLGMADADAYDTLIARCLPHLRDDQQPGLQTAADDPLDILIAGCGTGRHALWRGRQYRNSKILAVDLSSASLAYAMMKAEEFGIANIDFRQGDLLELPALGRQFDVIESTGVLHHMEDPGKGLAALARCLRPGGWVRISVYSHSARRAVRMARERIAERGCLATADGIRDFRHTIMCDETDPLHELCVRWRDFFALSDCRDLLFHVHEHQFTTEGLELLIASAGLEFMGFDPAAGIAVNAEPRITDWQSLRQWGEFENANPDFFSSMYDMWLRQPS